jgi:hypothetical protein
MVPQWYDNGITMVPQWYNNDIAMLAQSYHAQWYKVFNMENNGNWNKHASV